MTLKPPPCSPPTHTHQEEVEAFDKVLVPAGGHRGLKILPYPPPPPASPPPLLGRA